ncbi:MAG: hypothetical protein J6C13_04850, partial [Clostridia bacterium]|nr:hypothetical protein [Clostridia bacterium]
NLKALWYLTTKRIPQRKFKRRVINVLDITPQSTQTNLKALWYLTTKRIPQRKFKRRVKLYTIYNYKKTVKITVFLFCNLGLFKS